MRDLLEKILAYGNSFNPDYLEIRVVERNITSISIKDNNIESSSVGSEYGVGIRALVNGAWGFSSSSIINEDILKKATKDAIDMARGASNLVKMKVRLAETEPKEDIVRATIEIDPKDVSPEEKINTLLELNKGILSFDKRIRSVETSYADISLNQYFINSEGAYIEQNRVYVWSRIVSTAKENGITASGRHEIGTTKGYVIWKEQPVESIVSLMGERLLKQLSATTPKGGVWPAVLGPEVVGVFTHEAFGHLGEADLTFSGAVTIQKLGQKIASDLVTIVDDGTIPGAFGSFKYDDEGVPARRAILVKDGVLVGLMYNREFAAKFEDMLKARAPQLLEFFDVKPTGNARAESHRFEPIIRMRNTFIEPRDLSFEELIEDIKFGYYFVAFRGGQANLDGTFQVGIQEAYEIVNGELGQPVRNLSISGNTLDTLMEVDGVGKDFSLHPGRCGKGQTAYVSDGGPHIRVKKIVVGGEA